MHESAPDGPGPRLKQLRKSLGLTQSEMAASAGVNQATISRAERTGSIEPVVLIAICSTHGVSRDWLEHGRGPMFAGKEEDGDYARVPLVGVRLAAGAGAEIYNEGEVDALMFKTTWVRRELRASVRNLVAMLVSGDSMEPTLSAGDVVLVDRSRTNPESEGVYALRQDDGLLIKRTRPEGGRVMLLSDNPDYPPQVFPWPAPVHRAAVIGRVVWVGRRVD